MLANSALIKFAATYSNRLFIHGQKKNMSLEKIFSEVFAIPEATVLDALALCEIPSWDSLAHMMFIVRLEDDYKIQFTGDEIADIKTVGDTRAALQSHGVTP